MTITSPQELSVSNQGALNVPRIIGRSALITFYLLLLFWSCVSDGKQPVIRSASTPNPVHDSTRKSYIINIKTTVYYHRYYYDHLYRTNCFGGHEYAQNCPLSTDCQMLFIKLHITTPTSRRRWVEHKLILAVRHLRQDYCHPVEKHQFYPPYLVLE